MTRRGWFATRVPTLIFLSDTSLRDASLSSAVEYCRSAVVNHTILSTSHYRAVAVQNAPQYGLLSAGMPPYMEDARLGAAMLLSF